MSDQSVATIARDLVKAMLTRAKTRQPDDQKAVLALQTQLVAEVAAEFDPLPAVACRGQDDWSNGRD